MRTVSFPRTIEDVHDGAFFDVKSLRSAVVNEGLTGLGGSLFRRSGLVTAVLPSTLQGIGWETFDDCTGFRTLWVKDGCEAYVALGATDSLQILPTRDTLVNG